MTDTTREQEKHEAKIKNYEDQLQGPMPDEVRATIQWELRELRATL